MHTVGLVGDTVRNDSMEGVADRLAHFPALDPEPPPRSLRLKLAVSAGLMAAAGLVAGVTVALAGGSTTAGSRGPAAPTVSPPGRVVFVSTAGVLGISDPDGTHVVPSPQLTTGSALQAVVSPDGRYAALSGGAVVAVNSGNLVIRHRLDLARAMFVAGFADGDRDAVVLDDGRFGGYPHATSAATVLLDPLAGGPPTSLGVADAAVGDPQRRGAFVTVAAPGPPPETSSSVLPLPADSRVELRDAGAKPVVLATAASLAGALSFDPKQPVSFALYPDGAGDKLAILVVPIEGRHPLGIAVVDRAGRLLGTQAAELGSPSWSPDGTSLAVPTAGATGAEVDVWNVQTGSFDTWQYVDSAQSPGRCVWSADGSWLLCPTFPDRTTGRGHWDLVLPASGAAASVESPGLPLVWIGPP